MTVVKMEEKHIDQVYEIETSSFSIPWGKEDILKEVRENKHAVYYAAVEGETVAGYGGMWHVINEGHITNVAVREDARRMGVGGMILDALEGYANENGLIGLTLEVRISNEAAQRLYTKHGFKPEGFRKNYYADTGEDAVIMWKRLAPSARD